MITRGKMEWRYSQRTDPAWFRFRFSDIVIGRRRSTSFHFCAGPCGGCVILRCGRLENAHRLVVMSGALRRDSEELSEASELRDQIKFGSCGAQTIIDSASPLGKPCFAMAASMASRGRSFP